MNEIQLTQRIRQMVKREFPWVYVQRVSDKFISGVPDLRLIAHGMSADLEVKTATGKTTRIQNWTMDKIREAGGAVGVVRSVEEARVWLTRFSKEARRRSEIMHDIDGRTFSDNAS